MGSQLVHCTCVVSSEEQQRASGGTTLTQWPFHPSPLPSRPLCPAVTQGPPASKVSARTSSSLSSPPLPTPCALQAHKIILEARSPVFRALLNSPMREGQDGRVEIEDMKAAVFRVMLHYVYTDSLPEEHDGANLDVAMAQHLLVAADRYELIRLRR